MGNCCRAESSSSSSMIWAGDDWNSLLKDAGEGKRLLDGADGQRVSSSSSSSSSRRREIKIKISKEELEKLVQKMEAQELSLEEVLPLLINKNTFNCHGSGFAKNGSHRSWRPALQSIPEAI
ncbi:uncharacterized protein LOC120293268 [Eucalyptus grandis]|uniref:Uncharacterized protein n=2 Tax=Eucalyptus grandis TaxID=71139 RepID=A0A059CAN4_EUCGR|nr:uncharacterized protein LOC120293268 [Eucalyptus grandis]KAK3432040.1 hypothetical protein EUGRSUZ_E04065 [Eucalyptus grandis]